jgi:Xaa-Pro aminopeptidase
VTAAVAKEEFRERQQRATRAAAERGLDALVVWARGGTSVDFYGDVLYLSNHHSPFPPNQDTPHWSARSYSGMVLPVDGSPALVVDLPEFDADLIEVDDIHSTLHVPQTLARVLAERGLDQGRLGLAGRDTLLAHQLGQIEAELGHPVRLEPADDILERLRMVKSQSELAEIRRAAEVGIGWMRTMMEAVVPGRTEGEVIGDGMSYLAAHGGFPYDAAIASGSRSQYFFSRLGIPTWDARRRIDAGDLVHIDAWAAIDGYYTDFVRSTVAGREASPEQRHLLEGSIAIIDHIIEGTRPGTRIGELYERGAAWMVDNGFGEHRAELTESGTDFGNLFPAFGHSFGLGLESPWIVDGEPTVIEEGMCLAIEALLGRPGVGGAGFEQDVIVTADGCEVITAGCESRWWD